MVLRRAGYEGRLRSAFWPVPILMLVLGYALPYLTIALDRLVTGVLSGSEIAQEALDADQAVTQTIATAMLSFLGVVFSISLVGLQMAAGQLSPRLLRLFVRLRITKLTLGTFLATFAYALTVLGVLSRANDRNQIVPVFSMIGAWLLVTASLVLFVIFVNTTTRLMQSTFLIQEVASRTRKAIGAMYQDTGDLTAVGRLDDPIAVVGSRHSGVVTWLNIARLVRLAAPRRMVFRVLPRVGEHLVVDQPLVEVYAHHGHSTRGDPPAHRIRRAFAWGKERTVSGDPGYGLRLLVDVACRALSSAVNDPTTAVQAVDRIVDLVALIGNRPEPTGLYCDPLGQPRVLVRAPSWDQVVRLAFTEVRWYGATDPQVTRRVLAGLDDLAAQVSEERRPALLEQRALLVAAIGDAVASPAERAVFLEPDRQGLG